MDYQVVLAGEMILLVTGLTGVGMLHGWTEGVGYHMREYYTPLWTCAVIMGILLLLIISLFFVFVFLHFGHPGIIKQHIMALAIAWPISVCVIVSAVVESAPIVVGFLLILFFTSLLPFAYIYNSAEWVTTVDPPV
uniref:MARVEL domain-containing protein n=1 Tax=Heterorhabditis bacteriophora TaxID=37862 RepID=A0A1I7XJ98_HETBA